MTAVYVPDQAGETTRGRRYLWFVLVGVCAVVLVGLALVKAGGGSTSATPGAASPSTLSPEAVATVPEALASVYASGWLPYDGDDVLHPEPGGVAKPKGFAHYGENVAPGEAPIYDAPNGKIIGYAYSQLGYVAAADDAAFDAHARRVAKYGCDSFQDTGCNPAGLQKPAR